jgi:hypothetical protein
VGTAWHEYARRRRQGQFNANPAARHRRHDVLDTATLRVPRPPPPVCVSACTSGVLKEPRSSPSLHTGFLRTTAEPGSVLAPEAFQKVSILVDSGSQQEPLCSTAVARRLGAAGKLCSFALQAGGQPLPIYDVGWCDLGINGKPCRTQFKSAALSPFDVILGESWLRAHRSVLDYADNRLWQEDLEGNLRPLTFDLPGIATSPFDTTLGGSRVRRLQRRHPSAAFSTQGYLQAVLDFAKELPEAA